MKFSKLLRDDVREVGHQDSVLLVDSGVEDAGVPLELLVGVVQGEGHLGHVLGDAEHAVVVVVRGEDQVQDPPSRDRLLRDHGAAPAEVVPVVNLRVELRVRGVPLRQLFRNLNRPLEVGRTHHHPLTGVAFRPKFLNFPERLRYLQVVLLGAKNLDAGNSTASSQGVVGRDGLEKGGLDGHDRLLARSGELGQEDVDVQGHLLIEQLDEGLQEIGVSRSLGNLESLLLARSFGEKLLVLVRLVTDSDRDLSGDGEPDQLGRDDHTVMGRPGVVQVRQVRGVENVRFCRNRVEAVFFFFLLHQVRYQFAFLLVSEDIVCFGQVSVVGQLLCDQFLQVFVAEDLSEVTYLCYLYVSLSLYHK